MPQFVSLNEHGSLEHSEEYFNGTIARTKTNPAQIPLIEECERLAVNQRTVTP